MSKKLPTVARDLDSIRVASPCHVSWASMKGDDQVRFCGSCQKNVYDLSALTRVEAQALVDEMEGQACVRFYRRRDGTLLTQDCPVGLAAVRRRLAWIGAAVAACLGVVVSFLGLRREWGPQAQGRLVAPRVVRAQGQLVAPPPPPPVVTLPPPVEELEVEMGDMTEVQGGLLPPQDD
jgi:hypothetical protein